MEYLQGVLVFHIISFISWFAMLFYLPRLFVYHSENSDNGGFTKVVKIMEFKLFKYIGVPAMWSTILSGAYLGYFGSFFENWNWLILKLIFVVSLVCYQIYLNILRLKLEKDECIKSGKFFRVINEYPTIIMIFIVYLAIFKPF